MSMIERVARAMCAADGGSQEVDVHLYLDMAAAAIAAMREPTEAMTRTLWTGIPPKAAWQAMIDAALVGGEIHEQID
jgi:hypothetical protein